MAKDTEESKALRKNSNDEKLNLDNLDNLEGKEDSFDLDDDFDSDSSSNRTPIQRAKREISKRISSTAESAIPTFRDKIENRMPNAASMINDVSSFVNDAAFLRDEFARDINPIVQQLKTAGRQLGPHVKPFLPDFAKKFYDNITKEEETYKSKSKEQEEKESIDSEINSVLGKQFQINLDIEEDRKKDKIIDRAIGDHHHKQEFKQLSIIRTTSEFQVNFLRSAQLPYMKKSLELKLRHIFIAKETRDRIKIVSEILENKLDQIRHNTALPDIQKRQRLESLKATVRDRVNDQIYSYGKNILTNVKDKILGPGKEFLGMIPMLVDGLGLGEGKGSAYNTIMTLGSLFGGQFLGSYLGKKLVGDGSDTGIIGARLSERDDIFKDFKKNLILNLNTKKRLGGDSAAYNILRLLLPDIDEGAGSSVNAQVTNLEGATGFKNKDSIALTSVIPGLLSKQLQQLTILTSGNKNTEELIYDYGRQDFITRSRYARNIELDAFGSAKSRREKAVKTIGRVKSAIITSDVNYDNTIPNIDDYLPYIQKVIVNCSFYNVLFDPVALWKKYRGLNEKELQNVYDQLEKEDEDFDISKTDLYNKDYDEEDSVKSYFNDIYKGIPEDKRDKLTEVLYNLFFPDDKLNRKVLNAVNSEIRNYHGTTNNFKEVLGKLVTGGRASVLAGEDNFLDPSGGSSFKHNYDKIISQYTDFDYTSEDSQKEISDTIKSLKEEKEKIKEKIEEERSKDHGFIGNFISKQFDNLLDRLDPDNLKTLMDDLYEDFTDLKDQLPDSLKEYFNKRIEEKKKQKDLRRKENEALKKKREENREKNRLVNEKKDIENREKEKQKEEESSYTPSFSISSNIYSIVSEVNDKLDKLPEKLESLTYKVKVINFDEFGKIKVIRETPKKNENELEITNVTDEEDKDNDIQRVENTSDKPEIGEPSNVTDGERKKFALGGFTGKVGVSSDLAGFTGEPTELVGKNAIVGESSIPEAIIPLDGSSRSKKIWEKTREFLFKGTKPSYNETIEGKTRKKQGLSPDAPILALPEGKDDKSIKDKISNFINDQVKSKLGSNKSGSTISDSIRETVSSIKDKITKTIEDTSSKSSSSQEDAYKQTGSYRSLKPVTKRLDKIIEILSSKLYIDNGIIISGLDLDIAGKVTKLSNLAKSGINKIKDPTILESLEQGFSSIYTGTKNITSGLYNILKPVAKSLADLVAWELRTTWSGLKWGKKFLFGGEDKDGVYQRGVIPRMYEYGSEKVSNAVEYLGRKKDETIDYLRRLKDEIIFVDVYRKDEVFPDRVLLTASQQKEGVYHLNGLRLKSTYSIDGPILSRDGKVTFISQEDVDHGLVDANNNNINKKKAIREKFEAVRSTLGIFKKNTLDFMSDKLSKFRDWISSGPNIFDKLKNIKDMASAGWDAIKTVGSNIFKGFQGFGFGIRSLKPVTNRLDTIISILNWKFGSDFKVPSDEDENVDNRSVIDQIKDKYQENRDNLLSSKTKKEQDSQKAIGANGNQLALPVGSSVPALSQNPLEDRRRRAEEKEEADEKRDRKELVSSLKGIKDGLKNNSKERKGIFGMLMKGLGLLIAPITGTFRIIRNIYDIAKPIAQVLLGGPLKLLGNLIGLGGSKLGKGKGGKLGKLGKFGLKAGLAYGAFSIGKDLFTRQFFPESDLNNGPSRPREAIDNYGLPPELQQPVGEQGVDEQDPATTEDFVADTSLADSGFGGMALGLGTELATTAGIGYGINKIRDKFGNKDKPLSPRRVNAFRRGRGILPSFAASALPGSSSRLPALSGGLSSLANNDTVMDAAKDIAIDRVSDKIIDTTARVAPKSTLKTMATQGTKRVLTKVAASTLARGAAAILGGPVGIAITAGSIVLPLLAETKVGKSFMRTIGFGDSDELKIRRDLYGISSDVSLNIVEELESKTKDAIDNNKELDKSYKFKFIKEVLNVNTFNTSSVSLLFNVVIKSSFNNPIKIAYEYFDTWYKKRFLPIYSQMYVFLKQNSLEIDQISDLDDDAKKQVNDTFKQIGQSIVSREGDIKFSKEGYDELVKASLDKYKKEKSIAAQPTVSSSESHEETPKADQPEKEDSSFSSKVVKAIKAISNPIGTALDILKDSIFSKDANAVASSMDGKNSINNRAILYGVDLKPRSGFFSTSPQKLLYYLETDIDEAIDKKIDFPDIKLEYYASMFLLNDNGADYRIDKKRPACVYFTAWLKKRFIPIFKIFKEISGKYGLKVKDVDDASLDIRKKIINELAQRAQPIITDTSKLIVGEKDFQTFLKDTEKQKKLLDRNKNNEEAIANYQEEHGVSAHGNDGKNSPSLAQNEALRDRTVNAKTTNETGTTGGTGTEGGPLTLDSIYDKYNEIDTYNSNAPSISSMYGGDSTTYSYQVDKEGRIIPGTGQKSSIIKNRMKSSPMDLGRINIPNIPMSAGDGSDLGKYVKEFESGGRGPLAIGWDSTGGTSYGSYQVSALQGSAKDFVNWASKNGGEFGKQFSSAMWDANRQNPRGGGRNGFETGSKVGPTVDVWKAFAGKNKEGFNKLEHEFIKSSHYDKALNLLPPEIRQAVESDRGLQEALWSSAIQHGAGGAKSVFVKAWKASGGQGGEAFIKAIYAERSTRFPSSTSSVRASVQDRFRKEVGIALGLSKQQKPLGASTEDNNEQDSEAGGEGPVPIVANKSGGDTLQSNDASGIMKTYPGSEGNSYSNINNVSSENPSGMSSQSGEFSGEAYNSAPTMGSGNSVQASTEQVNHGFDNSGSVDSGTVGKYLSVAKKNAQSAQGYSQSKRTSPNYYDCSSFVSRSLRGAGLDVNPNNTTATLKGDLQKVGFKFYRGNFGPISEGQLKPGDILLGRTEEGASHNHTEIFTGFKGGKPQTVGAHSTSSGVSERNHYSPYNYTGFLRLEGQADLNPEIAQEENNKTESQQDVKENVGGEGPVSTDNMGNSFTAPANGPTITDSNTMMAAADVATNDKGVTTDMYGNVSTSTRLPAVATETRPAIVEPPSQPVQQQPQFDTQIFVSIDNGIKEINNTLLALLEIQQSVVEVLGKTNAPSSNPGNDNLNLNQFVSGSNAPLSMVRSSNRVA